MDNNSIDIGVELIKTVHIIKRVIDESLSITIDKGLTVPQAHLIVYLSKASQNKVVYQKDIETAFELHRSSVSLMLNHMEKQGLITREPVKSDARLKRILLTEKAQALQKEILREIQVVDTKLTVGITTKELHNFLRVLHKIRSNINEG